MALLRVPKAISLAKQEADAVIPAAATENFTDYEAETVNIPVQRTWYLATNRRGTGSATVATQKTDATAPAGQADYCTYIEVIGDYKANAQSAAVTAIYRLWPGANNTNDYNITGGTYYETAIIPRGLSQSDSRVKAYTDFNFGVAGPDGEHEGENSWKLKNLSRNGSANCYIVTEACQWYKFDARIKGNGKATLTVSDPNVWADQRAKINPNDDLIAPKPLAPVSAFTLWSTGAAIDGVIKNLTFDNGYVYFTTAGAKGDALTEGNAVIAVKDAGGNIIWSWHIWATNYDPATDDQTYITRAIEASGTGDGAFVATTQRTFTMMGRNLGSINNTPGDIRSSGLFYQWGRKDPFIGSATAFPGSNETTAFNDKTAPTQTASGYSWQAVVNSTAGTSADASIAYAIKNPTVFLYYSTPPYDWLNVNTVADQRDYLWGNPNPANTMPNQLPGSKSIYDPCPPGYRMPRADSWTRFTSTGKKSSTNSEWNTTSTTWVDGEGWTYYYSADGSGGTSFYPAAGCRYGNSGLLINIGTFGYYWSASPNYSGERYASNLNFSSSMMYPLNIGNHGHALSVRCAKE